MIAKFISEHLIDKEVDVYCGPPSNFSGKVIACADDVLTLEDPEKTLTFIALHHVIALWKKD